MAEITLRLRFNLETGKKDIYIDFVSEDDSLPIEHEQDHREIVEDLIGQGVLGAEDVGEVKVRRVPPAQKARLYQEQAEIERQSVGEGS